MTGTETVKPLLEEWLTKIKKPTITRHTYGYIAGVTRRYIYPHIGELVPSEITPEILQSVIDRIEAKTMAHKSRQILKEFFGYCVKSKIIKKNPAKKLTSPYEYVVKPNVNLKTLSEPEQERLLNVVSKHFFWHPFSLLILQSGIRLNELLCLSWKDIDFKTKRICIDKYVTQIGKQNVCKDTQKSFYIQKYHTSSAVRTIPISDDVLEALRKYKLFREVEQLCLRNHYSLTGGNDLVFGNRHGELLNYSGIGHVFKKYLERKGLPDLDARFSVMRYTCIMEQRNSASQLAVTDKDKPKRQRGLGSEM